MAKIGEIIKEIRKSGVPQLPHEVNDPHFIADFFAPLINAGFNDFVLGGSGSSSFYIRPLDTDGTVNGKIVFRVTTEVPRRRNDIPFFLAGIPIAEQPVTPRNDEDGPLRMEVLLDAAKYSCSTPVPLTEVQKKILAQEMRNAGWQVDSKYYFLREAILIRLRNANGRTALYPVISDPSDLPYQLLSSLPDSVSRTGVTDENITTAALEGINRCSVNYPTLQDQAAAYNAAREADRRLKKLIPQPVQFPKTEVIEPPQPEQAKIYD